MMGLPPSVQAPALSADHFLSGGKNTPERMHQVRQLVDAVIPEAASVKIFATRWSSILDRLQQFVPHLSDLHRCFASPSSSSSSSSNHTLCNELLLNISKSLLETKDLAERCLDEAFIRRGKLQMQSSLDSLSMKLEMHLQECELLVRAEQKRSGAVQPSLVAAMKESLRASARDLLLGLQVGSKESKCKAMEGLVMFMEEDDKNVLVVAKEGGIQTLVRMLDAGGHGVFLKEKAVSAIHRFTQIESCDQVLAMEGIFAPLVRILESGSSQAKEKAAMALKNLTHATLDNIRAVIVHGGVAALLQICRIGTPMAQSAAAGVIRNLASASDFRRTIADEGVIPILVGLLHSGTPSAQESACDGIRYMCSSDEYIRHLAIHGGAIHALLLYHDTAPSPTSKEVSMGALSSLSASTSHLDALLAAGFLPRLVKSLSCTVPFTQQEFAASAVCHLAKSADLQKLLGDAGCIPPLVRMLDGKTSALQERAAQAIASILPVDSNRRAFCNEDGSIRKMVLLLDPSNEKMDKKFPIRALLCLVGKKKWKKEMIAAGARVYLAKLVEKSENNYCGARKLLEHLECGKMWSLFMS